MLNTPPKTSTKDAMNIQKFVNPGTPSLTLKKNEESK